MLTIIPASGAAQPQEDWQIVAIGSDTGDFFYIDVASIRRFENVVVFWSKRKDASLGTEHTQLHETHCDLGQIRTVGLGFDSTTADNKPFWDFYEWRALDVGTVLSSAAEKACSIERASDLADD